LLDKTLTESIKLLDKASEQLSLLVCSGYEPQASSPSWKVSKNTHALSNGSVTSDKAAVVSRNKSTKKGNRHHDAHNSQGHLLNGN